MQLLLCDLSEKHLWPFTLTRPVHELRVGILTIREKWENDLGLTASHLTAAHLSQKFPSTITPQNLVVNGGVLPNAEVVEAVLALENGQVLMHQNTFIAGRLNEAQAQAFDAQKVQQEAGVTALKTPVDIISAKHQIFTLNGKEITADYARLADPDLLYEIKGAANHVMGDDIFIHPDAKVNGAFLNASAGPIYIGKGAEVMEGALIRGPFALCEGGVVKMGAKMYGDTTIGPYCKVGGEVSNSVFIGYSNKGHDGFVGNSVIGEWCNLGADTNTSNLKNNYGNVRVWDYEKGAMADTGQQFCGLMMGDHSKCGINTMFNTGTVVGVNANIFGGDFPPKFIPSFAWGGHAGSSVFEMEKAFEVAERMMQRRKVPFTAADQQLFRAVLQLTNDYRTPERGFSA